jgi:hypothetical protein
MAVNIGSAKNTQTVSVGGDGTAVVNSAGFEPVDNELIRVEINSGRIKRCPKCGWPSELMSGCNFVTCQCTLPWCFCCGKAKGDGVDRCPYGNTVCNSH